MAYPVPGLVFLDPTANLDGTEWNELNNRRHLRHGLTCQTGTYRVYTIWDSGRAVASLQYLSPNTLGNISFYGGAPMPMTQFLHVTGENDPLIRRFVASDGRSYIWSLLNEAVGHWRCLLEGGRKVAQYDPGPVLDHPNWSLDIQDTFQDIAVELLATLLIMRHIRAHGPNV